MDRAFAVLLKEHRLAAGLTQEALAARAGLGVRSIQGLERGAHQPLRDTQDRLALALDLPEAERARFRAAAAPPARQPRTVGSATLPLPRRHNLPPQLTSFIGREQELGEVKGLLASTRLLTLTGTGGVGKTRLALQVTAAELDRYPQGVWLVGLAPLADPTLVPGTVLTALGVPEQPGRPPLATVLAALRPRQLLLVLDNCEHLLDACAHLAETLLCACPHLRILATSREPLGLAGETRWRVPSLAVPGAGQVASPAAVARCAAVRLFVERARAVQPAFALSAANTAAVAAVCARLDGIPLALELAAARLGGLGVGDLAARLDQRFRLLTGGSRTALPRQRTLQATVAWSYDLLTPAEQALFARLSVFAGGWNLAAAEVVGTGEIIAAEEILDLLTQLVDKSLVLAEETADGSMRYQLLETLRRYGQERLAAANQTAQVQRRHTVYYLALVEHFAQVVTKADHPHWLDELEREHDNLRAVLARCLLVRIEAPGQDGAQAVETGTRLACALHAFWRDRDHRREGLAWLDRALQQGATVPPVYRARALGSAGILAGSANDLARATALLAASVALSREVGAPRELAVALNGYGWAMASSGQDVQAAAALEESLALARATDEPQLIAHALFHDLLRIVYGDAIERAEERARAWAAGAECLRLDQALGQPGHGGVQLHLGQLALYEGDYERARALLGVSLPMVRALGWQSTVAEGLAGLADVARAQGTYAEAAVLYTEVLTIYRQLGDQQMPAYAAVLARLTEVAVELGDWTAVQSDVAESLVLAQAAGREGIPQLAVALEAQAALAAIQGAPRRALRLAGAAAALRAGVDQPPAPSKQPQPNNLVHLALTQKRLRRALTACDQATLERRLAPARRILTRDEQTAAWAAGQALTPEQTITYALAPSPTEGGAPPLHLPPRQRDVTAAPARPRRLRAERLTWAVEHLRTAGPLSPRAYASAMAVSVDTALIDLRALLAQGLVRVEGTTKDRRYTLRADEISLPSGKSSAVGAAAER